MEIRSSEENERQEKLTGRWYWKMDVSMCSTRNEYRKRKPQTLQNSIQEENKE